MLSYGKDERILSNGGKDIGKFSKQANDHYRKGGWREQRWLFWECLERCKQVQQDDWEAVADLDKDLFE